MQYYCSQCKLAVIVQKGHDPIKACQCDAPIVGEMEGDLKGGTIITDKEK